MATQPRKRTKIDKTSAEIIAANDDLLTEILVRVPVKSIIKCKRVSKHLRSLINSVEFARVFDLKNKKTGYSGLFLYKHNNMRKGTKFLPLNENTTGVEVKKKTKVPGDFPKDSICILQACNGLFLCCSRYDLWNLDVKLYVCNATIKQAAVIPHPGFRPRWYLIGIGLAFDPVKSGEYKVVATWKSIPDCKSVYRVEVYETGNKFWRAGEGEILVERVGMPMFCNNGVFLNGAIYWLERNYHASKFNLDVDFAYYFDVNSEYLKQLQLPARREGSLPKARFCYFGASGDRLQLIERVQSSSVNHQLIVCEKKVDADWQVLYHIGFCDFYTDTVHSRDRTRASVLRVIRGEGDDELTVVLAVPGMILSYNVKTRSTKVLQICMGRDHDAVFFDWCHAFEYNETIYSVLL